MNSVKKQCESTCVQDALREARLIVLDFDGTLLDSMPMWSHVGTDYIVSKGIAAPEDLEDQLVTKTLEESGAYYISELGLPMTLDEYIADIYAFIDHRYRYELPLKEGADVFLAEICKWDKPICILTTTGKPLVEAAMTHHGLDCYQIPIFTCGELKMGKTTPDIYERIAQIHGVSVEHTLVFEDAPFAVMNAKLAGCNVVAIYDEAESRDEHLLEQYADYRIRRLTEACYQ